MAINGGAISPVSFGYHCHVISKDSPNQISSHDDEPANMHANASIPLLILHTLDFHPTSAMDNISGFHVKMWSRLNRLIVGSRSEAHKCIWFLNGFEGMFWVSEILHAEENRRYRGTSALLSEDDTFINIPGRYPYVWPYSTFVILCYVKEVDHQSTKYYTSFIMHANALNWNNENVILKHQMWNPCDQYSSDM